MLTSDNSSSTTIKELKNLSDNEEKLFLLIQEDKVDAAKELIENGDVRINCLNENGMNILDNACFKGNEELVELLIENGADADNRAHENGYTALMFAAISGNSRICQLLLDAGANVHATNSIGKTAAELAAFVGQHECVGIISSYISYHDVDVILHTKGAESDVIYPSELVNFIHCLTRTHAFHPVKLTFDVSENATIWKHVKKTLFTVDQLFEKQLRNKNPNEVLSLKLWLILHTLRELTKFVDEKLKKGTEKDEKKCALHFARLLIHANPEDVVRTSEERFVRGAIAAFPYKQAMLWQTLWRQISNIPFGKPPPAFVLICQALLGPRFVQTAHFCRTCWLPSSKKRCKNCKVYYCSVECQRFDWPTHKKCCEELKRRNEEEADQCEAESEHPCNNLINE